MKIYVISDTHFFHYNIIKYCGRPFTDEYEMNEYIISQWNSLITNDDVVFHLGDFSTGLKCRYGELREVFSRLNGQIHLIRGNHDHQSDEELLQLGFKSVQEFKIINDTMLVHYPFFLPKDKYNSKFQRFYDTFNMIYTGENCRYVLYGHSHEYPSIYVNKYNVAVDLHDFKPILLDDIFNNVFKNNLIQENIIKEKKDENI